jgi:MFS family permease
VQPTPDRRFFSHPTGNRLGLYAATFYLPSIPAAFLGDVLADRFGRRLPILAGCLIVVAGSVLNALAVNIAMWLVGTCTPAHDRIAG